MGGIIILLLQYDELIKAVEATQHTAAANNLIILIQYSLWVSSWLSTVNDRGYYQLESHLLVNDQDCQDC